MLRGMSGCELACAWALHRHTPTHFLFRESNKPDIDSIFYSQKC